MEFELSPLKSFKWLAFKFFAICDSKSKELLRRYGDILVKILSYGLIGDLDGIRTHDLRRDRAAF